MREPRRFSIPVKIAAAAAFILLVDAAIILVFGDRKWKGLETLAAAAILTPLSALFWPLFEVGGYVVLFGIDYARQAIWERNQRRLEEAREIKELQQKELAQARDEGREEGYKLGYDAGTAAERKRINGNGHNWMFGGYDDHR